MKPSEKWARDLFASLGVDVRAAEPAPALSPEAILFSYQHLRLTDESGYRSLRDDEIGRADLIALLAAWPRQGATIH